MIPFLETLIAAIVWSVANIVYVDMKRKGVHGFTRFAAFWAGTPTTWIWFFAVDEGSAPRFEPKGDQDEEALLEEVRRDRRRRLVDGDAREGREAEGGAGVEETHDLSG